MPLDTVLPLFIFFFPCSSLQQSRGATAAGLSLDGSATVGRRWGRPRRGGVGPTSFLFLFFLSSLEQARWQTRVRRPAAEQGRRAGEGERDGRRDGVQHVLVLQRRRRADVGPRPGHVLLVPEVQQADEGGVRSWEHGRCHERARAVEPLELARWQTRVRRPAAEQGRRAGEGERDGRRDGVQHVLVLQRRRRADVGPRPGHVLLVPEVQQADEGGVRSWEHGRCHERARAVEPLELVGVAERAARRGS
uniref:Uncharacterized protein n=1 Tax=Oryza meridionalis TaxID=40149 RepID=A0A0E0DM76_9ORYZ